VEGGGRGGEVGVGGLPIKLARTPGGVRRRAPLLGEHTEELLTTGGRQ
jgi:crotonobetainyl-CoA:carnitine CoA-transferase CaiB-like acyl-CoA transferase